MLEAVGITEKRVDKINGSRIRVTLDAGQKGVISYKYQHQILGLIYNFLSTSDPNYANWLHEEGYYASKDSKSFKLFCVSGIKFHCRIKAVRDGFVPANNREFLRFSFQIASPINQFLQHLIVGLFDRQGFIVLGNTKADIETVESLPEIHLGHSERSEESLTEISLKPLNSPIFVKKPMPFGQSDKFLFPEDKEFSGYLNKNLKDKYRALFGEQCSYDDLKFTFYDNITPPFAKGRSGGILPKPNISSFPIKNEGVSKDSHSRLDRESGSQPLEKKNTGGLHTSSAPPLIKGDTGGFIKKQPTEKVIEIPTKTGRPIKIKGTLKPFKVSGRPELIKLGLYAGFGANNSMGCGYVEVVEDA